MQKCGYRLDVDYVAYRTNAKESSTSATGWVFNSLALPAFYEKMGLKVTCHKSGVPKSGECRICGTFNKENCPKGTTAMLCDPVKHKEYYDALSKH